MAKINGTNVLLYADGQPIAMQKGLSLSVNDSVIDGTNKESLGWAECITGLKDAKIDCNALFGIGTMDDLTPVMSAKDLHDYILSREKIFLSISDIGTPIVGAVNLNSLSFEAPVEGAMTLSGSFKVNGRLFNADPGDENLISDPDSGGSSYDTLTVSDVAITSAIKSTAGDKYVQSNVVDVAFPGAYYLIVYITLTSGQLPTVGLWNNTSAYISNRVQLSAGLNLVRLDSTIADASASLRFTNTANANWHTGDIILLAPDV